MEKGKEVILLIGIIIVIRNLPLLVIKLKQLIGSHRENKRFMMEKINRDM